MPSRRTSAAWLSAALVTLAGAALCAQPAAASGAPATQIVHFRVFSASGQIDGVRVHGSLRGSCFSGSIGLPRPDAWRCTAGNEILDPCLESPRRASVPLVCVDGNGAIRLRLTKPLPIAYRNPPERAFFPWRLVLGDGDVCQRFTGTSAGAVQGEGLVYGCRSGGTTTAPRRARPAWTVRYLRKGVDPMKLKRLSQLELVPVVRAVG